MTEFEEIEVERLKRAITDAHRFIRLAEIGIRNVEQTYSKDRAAYRRASMDLTNSLVAVRRNKYS